MIKLCSQCVHLQDHNFGPCPNFNAPACMHPKNLSVRDYIRGGLVPYLSPRMQRQDGWLLSRIKGTCGKEGRFFKGK